MQDEIMFIVEDSLDGVFEARAVGHSIFTEAETLILLKDNIREAVSCHFSGSAIPKLIRLRYVKEEVIAA